MSLTKARRRSPKVEPAESLTCGVEVNAVVGMSCDSMVWKHLKRGGKNSMRSPPGMDP